MIAGATPEHLALIGDVLAYGGRSGSWDPSLGNGARRRAAGVGADTRHPRRAAADRSAHRCAHRDAHCRIRLPRRSRYASDRIRLVQGFHRRGLRAVDARNRRALSRKGVRSRHAFRVPCDADWEPRHAGALCVGFRGLASLLARSVLARVCAVPCNPERGVVAAQQDADGRCADDQNDGHVTV